MAISVTFITLIDHTSTIFLQSLANVGVNEGIAT